MRALLSLRFVAAVVGLVLAFAVVRSVTSDDGAAPTPNVATADAVTPRVINIAERLDRDISSLVINDDGVASTTATLSISDVRAVTIVEGTPGEISCSLAQRRLGDCALFADLLGEAVVWFSLQPVVDDEYVVLPAVTAFENDLAVLTNGMRLPHADVFVRRCPEDYASFTEMRDRVGTAFVSWWSVLDHEITDVVCTTE